MSRKAKIFANGISILALLKGKKKVLKCKIRHCFLIISLKILIPLAGIFTSGANSPQNNFKYSVSNLSVGDSRLYLARKVLFLGAPSSIVDPIVHIFLAEGETGA